MQRIAEEALASELPTFEQSTIGLGYLMSKRTLLLGFFLVLFVLHQDFWWKDDPTLVFGILPVSLAYHVGWTLLAALGWYLVGKYCWPDSLDELAQTPPTEVPAKKTLGPQ